MCLAAAGHYDKQAQLPPKKQPHPAGRPDSRGSLPAAVVPSVTVTMKNVVPSQPGAGSIRSLTVLAGLCEVASLAYTAASCCPFPTLESIMGGGPTLGFMPANDLLQACS